MRYAPFLCPDCYCRLIDTAGTIEPGAKAPLANAPLLECEAGCGVSDKALRPYRTRMDNRVRPGIKSRR